MTKSTKTGGKQSEHGTFIQRSLLETEAWRQLSPTAQILYIWLRFEWKGARYNNNGGIQLSYRQAAKRIGISNNTAMSAFRDLQAKGFVVVTQLGELGVLGEARGPKYELTELARSSPTRVDPRRLYLRWNPKTPFEVARHNVNNPNGRNGR